MVAPCSKLRTGEVKSAPAAPEPPPEPSQRRAADPQSLVPAPPDAPQPKGQLLDFIEALKKHRPGSAAKQPLPRPAKPAPAPAPAPVRAAPSAPFGLGYGPRASTTRRAGLPQPAQPPRRARSVRSRPVLARRAPPRPRRVRAWSVPSRKWRSLAYKLLIGIGIAGLAVAYQNQPAAGGGARRQRRLEPGRRPRAARAASSAATAAPCSRVATDDQGRWIVSIGADGTLKMWNAGSGALVRTIELDEGPAGALAVDDQPRLTGHKSGAIVLWDLERAEKLGVFQHQEAPVSTLAFTGDGNQFAAASEAGAVTLFDVAKRVGADGRCSRARTAPRRLAGARASALLVAAGQDRSIRLWRTDTRSLARTWRGQGEAPSALGISPGGRTVASGSAAGSVRLWSTTSSRLQRSFKAHQGRVTSLAFAPNDRLLASAGEDGQVKLWDLRSRRAPRVLRGHAGPGARGRLLRRRAPRALRRRRTASSASGAAPWYSPGNSPPSSRRRAGPSHVSSVAMPLRCMGPVPSAPRWQRGACTG